MEGRVASIVPVWNRLRAGVCVGLNVYIDRITHMSSITEAMLRQQAAHLDAARPVLLELERRGQQAAGLAFGAQVDRSRPLALILQQRGLGVEHVQLRGAAGHERG